MKKSKKKNTLKIVLICAAAALVIAAGVFALFHFNIIGSKDNGDSENAKKSPQSNTPSRRLRPVMPS